MPFLRLSRDQRGYENTFLLHVASPGARPLVLYWYRSAPAVRVGRRALDEDAIRAIEEQHPEIEFDWPNILEEANTLPPEVERRQERPRRKPTRPREQEAVAPRAEVNGPRRDTAPEPEPETETPPHRQIAPQSQIASPHQPASRPQTAAQPQTTAKPPFARDLASRRHEAGLASSSTRNPLLDELVGREIAARLRSRAAEIQARIARASVDDDTRAGWQSRADALDPDSWTTPAAILDGVQRADALVDELRREISVTE